MRQVTPKLWLGNMGEAGDANALQAAGIELAVMAQPGHFPHMALPSVAFFLNGNSPTWYVRGLAELFRQIYGVKIIGGFDERGGMNWAAHIVCCSYANAQNRSYAQALVWLRGLVPEVAIDSALQAQGQGIWP